MQPTLIFEEGDYRFDQSDTTNKGHPLRLSATEDGIHNGGSEYSVDTNVVGVAGEEGLSLRSRSRRVQAICFITAYFTVVWAVDLTLLVIVQRFTDAPSIEVGDDTFLQSPFWRFWR